MTQRTALARPTRLDKEKYVDLLLRLAQAYGDHQGRSLTRVSVLIYNQGIALRRLSEGGNISMDRLVRGFEWLEKNWPEDVEWPDWAPPKKS